MLYKGSLPDRVLSLSMGLEKNCRRANQIKKLSLYSARFTPRIAIDLA